MVGNPPPRGRRGGAHRGVVEGVRLRDGDVVVGELVGDQLEVLGVPKVRVEIGKVVVEIKAFVRPSAQCPAGQLRALQSRQRKEGMESPLGAPLDGPAWGGR